MTIARRSSFSARRFVFAKCAALALNASVVCLLIMAAVLLVFTEAIRLLPSAWDCYHGRALAYRALGALDEAVQDECRMRSATG